MGKKAKTLLILSAALVVLIGGYAAISLHNAKEAQKQSEKEQALKLYSSGRGDPVRISYVAGGDELSFENVDGKWYYVGDHDFPVKQSALESLASALKDLKAVREIDSPESLSTYGLDKPVFSVTASDAQGNSATILIGSKIGDNYYAKLEGSEKVYTIPPAVVDSLEGKLLSLVDLDDIPVLTQNTLNSVTISSAEKTLTLDKHKEKDGTVVWFIVEGSKYTRADEYGNSTTSGKWAEKYVEKAVSALGSAGFSSCAAFKPSDDELRAFGLSPPEVTVTADYTPASSKDGKAEEVTLEIGRPLEDDSGYYARLSGSNQVNILSAEDVGPIIEALTALGSRK